MLQRPYNANYNAGIIRWTLATTVQANVALCVMYPKAVGPTLPDY